MHEKLNRRIAELDLEPIMVKALDPEEGYGWSLEHTKKVALEYRRFLLLCGLFADEPVVPSSQIDDFWHLHILDTKKYAEDCNVALGFFLHHFPYFGMRGAKDAQDLANAWKRTLGLYEQTFGEPPAELWTASNRCPNCGRRCRKRDAAEFEVRPRLSDVTTTIAGGNPRPEMPVAS